MGKTALFYHSGGSSGYESMLRDSSENTGSTSSAQDSLSEHSSATTSSRRSSKSGKKNRTSTGHSHTFDLALTSFSQHLWDCRTPPGSPAHQTEHLSELSAVVCFILRESLDS